MLEGRTDIKVSESFRKMETLNVVAGRGQFKPFAYLRLKKMREAGGSKAWKEDLIPEVWGESA